MSVVQKYRQTLKGIDVQKMVRKILTDNQKEVFEILQDEQLGKGLDSEGKLIGTYSKATDAIASSSVSIAIGSAPRKDKIAGEPYNFEWTGDLFDKFGLTFESSDTYTLFSRDGKADLLKEKYGNIFDFTENHNDRINSEIIAPALNKLLKDNFNAISRHV